MAVIRRPGSGGYSVESLPPVTAPESYALSIGEDGRVTGFVGEIDGARVGVVWTPLTSGWRVDTIGPDEAHGINESGLVVGEVSEIGQYVQEAWMWTPAGGLQSLGPGAVLGVNERNEVIGHAEDFVAVLWKLTRP
jgi:hypothetical protein